MPEEFDRKAYKRAMSEAINHIEERIHEACEVSGRARSEVKLIAVSKTVDLAQVEVAYELGLRYLGENRPQELVRKYEGLIGNYPDLHFHMIGNLQSNKINSLLGKAELIHSVSSLKPAKQINTRAAREDLVQDVLLEVNISGEKSKEGMSSSELKESFEELLSLDNLHIIGLMTMAPQGDLGVAEKCFEDLRMLRDSLEDAYPSCELSELSMGMSEDFSQAIRQGATIIRLGRSIFDPQFRV